MSTAPVTDERKHRDALVALLSPLLGGHVYDYGKVPGDPNNPDEVERAKSLPEIFAQLAVERRFVPNGRMAAYPSRSGWRVEVRCTGRTVDEARWALARVAEALEPPARLVVDGVTATPVQHESTDAPRLDEGRYSARALLTYSL